MSYTNTNVLHHLNKPMRVLIWSMDEIAIYLSILIIGVLMDSIILAFLAMYISGFVLRRFKASFGVTGGFSQLRYWLLPQWNMPKSNVKEYLS